MEELARQKISGNEEPNTFSHLVNRWAGVRRVPDFLVFSLEHGIVGLNQHLLNII